MNIQYKAFNEPVVLNQLFFYARNVAIVIKFTRLQALSIFFSNTLNKIDPWNGVLICFSRGVISFTLGIYSVVQSVKKNSHLKFITLPVGITTSLFALCMIGFTWLVYFLPEAGMAPEISY